MQSVALRIICDREDEINAFIPEEYWSLDGEFPCQRREEASEGEILRHRQEDADSQSRKKWIELLTKLENAEYEITEVKKGERIKNAPLPFTTSTLQQEASKTLNFSTQKTMRLAQQLIRRC